jgi:hypothetical protein
MSWLALWAMAGLLAVPSGTAAEQWLGTVNVLSSFTTQEEGARLAYNSLRDEYLMVWREIDKIWAKKVDREGRAAGSVSYEVSLPTANMKARPEVAYDEINDRYLVVYQYAYSADDWDIRGRFVHGDGVVTHEGDWQEFVIENTADGENRPSVAFDRWHQKFLVTWDDWNGVYYKVRGAFVVFGGGAGYSFDIACHASEHRWLPKVAWDPWSSKFLVVYDNTVDVLGKLVTAPDAIGSEIAIAGWPSPESTPAVATCENFQFLVVWQSDNTGLNVPDIYGRAVAPDGSLPGDVAHIADASSTDKTPSVACTRAYGAAEYLVAWHNGDYWIERRARRVATNLTMQPWFEARGSTAGYSVDVEGGADGWLVVWEETPDPYLNKDILGRLVYSGPQLLLDDLEWGSTAKWSSTGP